MCTVHAGHGAVRGPTGGAKGSRRAPRSYEEQGGVGGATSPNNRTSTVSRQKLRCAITEGL
eukprot:CAMPEP_0176289298 /NCGR_PEP_ID=MMETSP0121_2-20121125/54424_1 /TAXON_ID=160619 /ORGANISM="Kryptoperidinium foliaceum, Strain CCMP 1326" /LENGTH=60 /DNA_ID=CAMNT_0017630031 /DNA_START=90 /DNA_END=269 /DNA_ORIENTATION=+